MAAIAVTTALLGLIAVIIELSEQTEKLSVGEYYTWQTATLFFLTGLAQLVILSMLYYIIGKNFKDDLNSERKQLLICQSIFVVSFITRVVLIF